MILLIDNYDSFTWNLAQYLGELGAHPLVRRNDEIDPAEILALAPRGIVLSPGPKRPEDTEPTNRMIRELGGKIPMLGVCLGHQCMAYVHGATVRRAERLMHGKTSLVHYRQGDPLYLGLPNPFRATRYHSLIVERATLGGDFEITAWTDEDEIMGMRHRSLALWGVQYHPESILTDGGMDLLRNFLALADGCASNSGVGAGA